MVASEHDQLVLLLSDLSREHPEETEVWSLSNNTYYIICYSFSQKSGILGPSQMTLNLPKKSFTERKTRDRGPIHLKEERPFKAEIFSPEGVNLA